MGRSSIDSREHFLVDYGDRKFVSSLGLEQAPIKAIGAIFNGQRIPGSNVDLGWVRRVRVSWVHIESNADLPSYYHS
jgi:hypothetical protein